MIGGAPGRTCRFVVASAAASASTSSWAALIHAWVRCHIGLGPNASLAAFKTAWRAASTRGPGEEREEDMTPDHFNATFEGGGAAIQLINVRQLLRDKTVRSFAGGLGVVAVNAVNLFSMWLYWPR
jgi:hypothetical protein